MGQRWNVEPGLTWCFCALWIRWHWIPPIILLVNSIFLSLSIVFVFCTVVLMDLLVYCTLNNKPNYVTDVIMTLLVPTDNAM